MVTTNELQKKFKNAERKITELVSSVPETTSVRFYVSQLKEDIRGVYDELSGDSGAYVENEIPNIYRRNVSKTARNVKTQYENYGEEVPEFVLSSVRDRRAIENAKTNTGAYLSEAIQFSSRSVENTINSAETTARSMTGTQNQATSLTQELISIALMNNGIPGAEFLRNNGLVRLRLSAYVQMVLDGSQREIENISSLNFATNNGYDLVQMTQHFNSCAICMPYQGRVFSISGTNPDYPALYDTPWSEAFQNFHPNCRHLLNPWIEPLQTREELATMKEYSNRSFEIGGQGWTREQTQRALDGLEAYRARQERNRQVYADRKQFERYRARLGDRAPKTFSVFRRVKTANGKRWNELKREYREIIRAYAGAGANGSKLPDWVNTDEGKIIVKALKATNPKFVPNPPCNGYNMNCQRCVGTFEMIVRGNSNIEAAPQPFPKQITQDTLARKPFDIWKNKGMGAIDYTSKQDIEKQMAIWGDGARAEVRIMFDTYSGHVFTAVQVQGRTIFIDSQTNSQDCSWYFNSLEQAPGFNQILRIDNLEPSELMNLCYVKKEK